MAVFKVSRQNLMRHSKEISSLLKRLSRSKEKSILSSCISVWTWRQWVIPKSSLNMSDSSSQLLREVMAQRSPSLGKKFAEIQTDISFIDYKPMSFKEAHAELSTILPLNSGKCKISYYVFPIFFDEFDSESEDFSKDIFQLLKSIVRSIDFLSAFIGRNVKEFFLVEDTRQKLSKGSRCDYYSTDCLLWFRLPKLSIKIKNGKIKELKTKLSKWRLKFERNVYPTKETLNSLFSLLENGCPLFFLMVNKVLMHHFKVKYDLKMTCALWNSSRVRL